jgi:Domain of unknown function (DUF4288)
MEDGRLARPTGAKQLAEAIVRWYSVRVLLRCTGKGQPRRIPVYEDRIVVASAKSHELAKRKAREIVGKREVPYKNPLGNKVHWRVAEVYESVELFEEELKDGRFTDGAQIYWRFIRSSDPVKRLKREGTMNALY